MSYWRALGMLTAFSFVLVATGLPVSAQLADGECTVPLDVAPLADVLNDILSNTTSGTEVASHGTNAPFTDVSPVADGVINPGEYPNTCFYSFADRENPGNPYPGLDTIDNTGDADLSLKLHLGHTDEFLFIGYEVTDEFLDLDDGVNAFTNDSVELFINADLDVEDFNPDAFGRNGGGEGFQIAADSAGEGDLEFNNRFSQGGLIPNNLPDPPPEELEFYTAGLPNDQGWMLEWQIPLATLDTDSDDNATVVPAKTGDVMLWNFAINDNDFEGAGGQDTHAMLWVVEDDPRSPFGGGENVWTVPLVLSESAGDPCDFDGDGSLGEGDINLLSNAIATGSTDAQFDVNADGSVNLNDLNFFVGDASKLNTWIGDANLDGLFNSSDFVAAFTAGEYEDATDGNSGWSEGDWNADLDFDSSDFVAAFTDGGYEQGMKPAAAVVPEPTAGLLTALAVTGLLWRGRRRSRR